MFTDMEKWIEIRRRALSRTVKNRRTCRGGPVLPRQSHNSAHLEIPAPLNPYRLGPPGKGAGRRAVESSRIFCTYRDLKTCTTTTSWSTWCLLPRNSRDEPARASKRKLGQFSAMSGGLTKFREYTVDMLNGSMAFAAA